MIDRLFEVCAAQVIGNYDLKVLKFPLKKKKWQQSKKREKYIAFQWAWENLSAENAEKLAQLPHRATEYIEGFSFLLTHGGPEVIDEAIGEHTPDKRLKELAAMTDAGVILAGHTHLPYMRTIGRTTFINPGSVGRPEGDDPRACYALLQITPDGLHVRFRKVAYDLERLSRAIHAAGLPEDFTKMFESGKNLDRVQDNHVAYVDVKQPDQQEKIEQVRRFARACRYEMEHSEQVLKLSILLFEKLTPVHRLHAHDLYLLTCAAILHDIGWMQGRQAHHKKAMQMILNETGLPLDETERKMVALIARYHRKALPGDDHAFYQDLPAPRQKQVCLLAGILRMADGLDRSHMSAVQDIDVRMDEKSVLVRCTTRGPASAERVAAQKKGDLFEQTTGLKMQFETAG